MNQLTKLALTNGKEIRFVHPEEIVYCKSDGNYTYIHVAGQDPLMMSKSLKEISKNLPERLFFRIHNSFLINLTHVEKFTETTESFIFMADGAKLPVSRRKKSDFLARFIKV